jgi:thiosulfate dehydrogenase
MILFKLTLRGLITVLILLAYTIPAQASSESAQVTVVEEIESLAKRPFLDDYLGNVLYGYRIITETETYAARYTGNRLRCTNCHLEAGTRPGAIPLFVSGMYPKWRSKNGRRNGIGLRIRECFVYSLNGLMPPENAPEVLALAAYISHISKGQIIGISPLGRGVPTIPETGNDPNPSYGQILFQKRCTTCHGLNGGGTNIAPPLWGIGSYNIGAGMHRIRTSAGFIWANMPPEGNKLSHQEALDIAAFLHVQLRPTDPRANKLTKLMEQILRVFLPISPSADVDEK